MPATTRRRADDLRYNGARKRLPRELVHTTLRQNGFKQGSDGQWLAVVDRTLLRARIRQRNMTHSEILITKGDH